MIDILSDIPTFLITLVIGTVLEAIVIWVGLVVTGLATTFVGLLIMSSVLSAVWLLLPIYAAIPIGTILFYFLARKFTDAEGFVDVQLLIIVMNLVSFLLQLYIFTKAVDYLPESFRQSETDVPIAEMTIELNRPQRPTAARRSQVESVEPEQPSRANRTGAGNAYDAYSGDISQEERDRINKLTSFSDELANEIQQGR